MWSFYGSFSDWVKSEYRPHQHSVLKVYVMFGDSGPFETINQSFVFRMKSFIYPSPIFYLKHDSLCGRWYFVIYFFRMTTIPHIIFDTDMIAMSIIHLRELCLNQSPNRSSIFCVRMNPNG